MTIINPSCQGMLRHAHPEKKISHNSEYKKLWYTVWAKTICNT